MKTLIIIISLLYFSVFSFSQNVISCDVYGSSTNPAEWSASAWNLNGEMQEYSFCGNPIFLPSIHVAIVDKDSCKAWATCNSYPNIYFNQVNDCLVCRARPERYYVFRINDSNSMAYLDSMLTNSVLNGHHLLMYSGNCTDFNYLNTNYPNTIQILQNLGFTNVPSTSDKLPFIFYAEVGSPSTAIEVYGQDSTSYINLTTTIQNCGSTLEVDEISHGNYFYPSFVKNGEMINVNYEAITVYDLSGKLIQQKNTSGSSYLINNLSKGVYIVKVKNLSKEFIQKIIVNE